MITITNLTKKFEDRLIFDNIHLQFEKGKSYALVGASGSGKTTLLNIIAHLETYNSGQVSYAGTDITAIKPHDYFRHYLGYLFQNFGLLESGTVQDNLALGLVGKKLSKQEKESRYRQALDTVNLTYIDLNQKIYSLSGGEAQRVALAKLILKAPPLILADEPTAALDPQNAADVMAHLLSLQTPDNIIIIATHNPDIWEKTDHIVSVDQLNAKH